MYFKQNHKKCTRKDAKRKRARAARADTKFGPNAFFLLFGT